MEHPERRDPLRDASATTEVVTTHTPAQATTVDRVESVTADPYEHRRAAAEKVTQAIWLIFGLVNGLIALRIVLKLLGANPNAGFAELVYGLSDIFLAPFVGLFGVLQTRGSVFEPHAVVAILAYLLLAWLFVKLAWLLWGETRTAVKTSATSVDTRLRS